MSIFNLLFKRKKESFTPFNNMYTSNFSTINKDATTFACMDLVCGAFASLSLHVYDKVTGERVNHWLDNVIDFPNYDEPKFLFFYSLAKDYLNGNVYLYKWETDGILSSLFRIDGNNVVVKRNSFNNKEFTINGVNYGYKTILHIPSRFGYDGTKGKSIFKELESTFRMMSDMDDHVNNAFSNSFGKRTVIDVSETGAKLTKEQEDALRGKYMEKYSGSKNAGLPIIKSDKIKFDALDLGNADNRAAQLLENREFNEKEVSKIFGVPLSLILGENKYGDIETLYTVFIDNAIKPIAENFEGYLNMLLFPNEREKYEVKFNYNSLMKTSLTARIDAYTKQVQYSMLTPNEIRKMEGLQPFADTGDTPFMPTNLMPNNKETIDAYMATSKLKIIEAKNIDNGIIGDDKK